MLGNIKFNDLKTYKDLGFSIADIEIGFPEPSTKLEKIPFSNQYLDFSYVSGALEYSTREIKVVFKLESLVTNMLSLNTAYFNLVNSLTTKEFKRLEIDFLEGYFLGKLQAYTPYNLMAEEGTIEVTFLCMPFRNTDTLVGEELWDTFVFATDILQETEFTINGTKDIILYNQGKALEPVTIQSNATIKVTYNGIEYNVKNGTNKDVFKLGIEENKLKLSGTGTIKFLFYKEVL